MVQPVAAADGIMIHQMEEERKLFPGELMLFYPPAGRNMDSTASRVHKKPNFYKKKKWLKD